MQRDGWATKKEEVDKDIAEIHKATAAIKLVRLRFWCNVLVCFFLILCVRLQPPDPRGAQRGNAKTGDQGPVHARGGKDSQQAELHGQAIVR